MTANSTHECPGPQCKAQISASQLMCRPHWAQVPPPLQREVYAAWDRGRGRGSDRHTQAIMAAIKAVSP